MNPPSSAPLQPGRLPAWLSVAADLALVAAVLSVFFSDTRRFSAGATTIWLGLELLVRTGELPWSWGGLAILLTNLRGVVLEEGPSPVSHMDFVVMILAFLVGFGRSMARWRRTSALVCIACMAGVLLHAGKIWDFAWWGFEYQTPLLTKNQTALLAGFAALCGVMAAMLARNRRLAWLVLGPCIAGCLVLDRATLSRAGLAFVPLALLAATLLVGRRRCWWRCREWWRAIGAESRQRLLAVAGLATAAVLLLLVVDPLGLRTRLAGLYGAENLANDMGRLRVWSCYLGLPFLGENRFIYGVGYENSWKQWCTPEQTGRFLTHAHNLPLQIWGDTGVIPFTFLMLCLGIILWRMLRISALPAQPQDLGGGAGGMAWTSSAIILYLLAFNSIELGMLKVPVLTALFGHYLASVFHDGNAAPPRSGQPPLTPGPRGSPPPAP